MFKYLFWKCILSNTFFSFRIFFLLAIGNCKSAHKTIWVYTICYTYSDIAVYKFVSPDRVHSDPPVCWIELICAYMPEIRVLVIMVSKQFYVMSLLQDSCMALKAICHNVNNLETDLLKMFLSLLPQRYICRFRYQAEKTLFFLVVVCYCCKQIFLDVPLSWDQMFCYLKSKALSF